MNECHEAENGASTSGCLHIVGLCCLKVTSGVCLSEESMLSDQKFLFDRQPPYSSSYFVVDEDDDKKLGIMP